MTRMTRIFYVDDNLWQDCFVWAVQIEHIDTVALVSEGIAVYDHVGLVGNGFDIRHKLYVHF